MIRIIKMSIFSLICISIYFQSLPIWSSEVSFLQNDVPISMKFIEVKNSEGIALENIQAVTDSGKDCKALIICSAVNGKTQIEFKVSKMFISKIVTVELNSKQLDDKSFLLTGRYKIGKDSKKWSSVSELGKFKPVNDIPYILTQKDIHNKLIIKKM